MTRGWFAVSAAGLMLTVAACGGGDSDVASTDEAPATSMAPAATMAPATPDVGEAEGWVETDVVYATRIRDGKAYTLEMYLPADPVDAPIVIDTIQGFHNPAEAFAANGVIAVVPEVGLRSPASVVGDPAALRAAAEQYACAIRLARTRAAALGNDDPRVVLTGFSRFGAAATHVGLLGDTFDEAWEGFAEVGGPPRQLDCEAVGATTQVGGVVSTGGAYGLYVPVFEGELEQEHEAAMREFLAQAVGANPELTLHLLHGTDDLLLPGEVDEFTDVMTDAGYDAQLTMFDGGHVLPPTELFLSTVSEALNQ